MQRAARPPRSLTPVRDDSVFCSALPDTGVPREPGTRPALTASCYPSNGSMMESLVPLVVLLLCSGLTAYGATYVVRQAAVRAGLLDRPGDERRIHETDTPRLGGLA